MVADVTVHSLVAWKLNLKTQLEEIVLKTSPILFTSKMT